MVCGLPDTGVEEAYLMLSSSLYGGRCRLSEGESPPHHGFARSVQELRETFTACMQDSCTVLQIFGSLQQNESPELPRNTKIKWKSIPLSQSFMFVSYFTASDIH
jgi:hypothetical protein